jgi:hypothetical protein
MSNGIDVEFVRENYRKMTDDELVRVATQDAAGLTPQAQEVVKTEINKRGLDANIIEGVKAQNKGYSIAEIDGYCEMVRDLDCPMCGASDIRLNGTLTSEVMSFIVFTHSVKKIKIACPDCLDKANDRSLAVSAALGWWGIPWGIIRTIGAIGQNIKSKKTTRLDEANDYLRSFILAKVGQVETYKADKDKLQEIISET